MIIVANLLFVVLLPLTLITASALRELQRVRGPDTMGPAFVSVMAGGARYLLAVIALGMLIGLGRLDGLVQSTALQILALYCLFAVIDVAAGYAIVASAANDARIRAATCYLGAGVGFGLPVITVLLLLLRLNSNTPAAIATRATALILLMVSLPTWLFFGAVYRHMRGERRRKINAHWTDYTHSREQATAELEALPADGPLDKVLPFYMYGQPHEVIGLAFSRIGQYTDLPAQLITVLAGPQRDLAINYLNQCPDLPGGQVVPSVIAVLLDRAVTWRESHPPTTSTSADAVLLDAQISRAMNLSYRFEGFAHDFRPVLEAWQEILSALPEVDELLLIRASLRRWLYEHTPSPVQ